MHEFIAKHQDKIAGTLSGFDRLVFRGHLRSVGQVQGMMSYLWANQVLNRHQSKRVLCSKGLLPVCPPRPKPSYRR
jgi:hypothetical protein